jgi:hypothetical protein
MGRLREWALDWIDRSGTEPAANRKIDDPLTLLPKIVAAIAGIVAIFSSPAISFLVPNLNANAAVIFRVLIVLLTLAAVNYIVTAKDVANIGIAGAPRLYRYRFSTQERLIARGVVAVALLVTLLNFVPSPQVPRDCALTATVSWDAQREVNNPLFLTLNFAGGENRYPVGLGKPIAMLVPAGHISNYSIALQWPNNARSEFGVLSGCLAKLSKDSSDGRAKIVVQGR